MPTTDEPQIGDQKIVDCSAMPDGKILAEWDGQEWLHLHDGEPG